MNLTISPNITKTIYQNKKKKEKEDNNTNNLQNINLNNKYILSKDGVQALKNNISFGQCRCHRVEDFHKKLNRPDRNRLRMLREFEQTVLRNRQRFRHILRLNRQEHIQRTNRVQIAELRQKVATINNLHLQQNVNLIINALDNAQSLSSFQTNVKLRVIRKLIEFKERNCDRISLAESLITPEFISNNNFNVQDTNNTNGYTIIVTSHNIQNSYVKGVKFANMENDIGHVNSVTFNFVKYEDEENYVLDDFEISAKSGESLSNISVIANDNSMHNVENVNKLSFNELKSFTEPDSYFIDHLIAEPEDCNFISINNNKFSYLLINNNLEFFSMDPVN